MGQVKMEQMKGDQADGDLVDPEDLGGLEEGWQVDVLGYWEAWEPHFPPSQSPTTHFPSPKQRKCQP